MYVKTLKFLTNLLFKHIFRGFLTPRKRRLPLLVTRCQICGWRFTAYNKRQRICLSKDCAKVDRARQYRARISFADSQRKAAEIASQSEASVYQTGVVRPEGEE